MSARWMLGGGLVLVAGLAGFYFYLESTAPRPDPTPPPEVSLGAEGKLDDAEGDLPDLVKSSPAPKKGAVAAKSFVDPKTDDDAELPPQAAAPIKAPAKGATSGNDPVASEDPALPDQPIPPGKATPGKQPPQVAEKEPEPLPAGPQVLSVAQKSPKKVVVTDSDKPLFEGWENPAAIVLLTGEMHGYVEPCGCAVVQLGGLARRDDLLRQIREERKWPATCFDLGGLINRPHRSQAGPKSTFAFNALKDMKYAGVALGVEEMKLDFGSLLGKPAELELLGSNISMVDNPEQFKPLVVAMVGQTKIAAATVFGKSLKAEVFPNPQKNRDPQELLEYAPPIETLKKLVPKVVATKADVKILLAHASVDEAKQYAKEFPEFDVILYMGPEDPDPDPKFVGKTMLVSAGHKGKSVGVLGFFPNEKQRLRWELVKLDPFRFKNSPRMVRHMREYQDLLQQLDLAKNLKPLAAPNDTDFVGAEKCGDCHTRAFAKWEKTKHAQATESLKKGRKGQEATWINRVHDPECLSCHVTGWHPQEMIPYKSGFVDERVSKHLLGQQCENCHGPGAKHVAAEEAFMKSGKKRGEESADQLALRKLRHLDLKTAKSQTCVMCHDHDNSPEFNFEKYWKEVEHPWKD